MTTHVFVAAGQGGIRRDSVAKCELLAALDKEFLFNGPLGGRLPDELLDQIVVALRRAVGEVIP